MKTEFLVVLRGLVLLTPVISTPGSRELATAVAS